MKLTSYSAEKSSRDGKILVEGLFTDAKGETEQVIVIRASEPAAKMALVALADGARIHSYPQKQQDDIMAAMRKVHEWQGANGTLIPDVTTSVKKHKK